MTVYKIMALRLKPYFPMIALIWLILMIILPGAFAEEPPFILPPKSELNKLKSAIIYTARGEIYLELYPEEAPWHVANFKYLADKELYKGGNFHIYIPNYIVQGGVAKKKPSEQIQWELPAEFNEHKHEPGALGMARKPDSFNPERKSSGGEFHILFTYAPHMDGSYTVFGKVIGGMEVAEKLRKGDAIKDIKVFVRE